MGIVDCYGRLGLGIIGIAVGICGKMKIENIIGKLTTNYLVFGMVGANET